jgi:hypothetical protein
MRCLSSDCPNRTSIPATAPTAICMEATQGPWKCSLSDLWAFFNIQRLILVLVKRSNTIGCPWSRSRTEYWDVQRRVLREMEDKPQAIIMGFFSQKIRKNREASLITDTCCKYSLSPCTDILYKRCCESQAPPWATCPRKHRQQARWSSICRVMVKDPAIAPYIPGPFVFPYVKVSASSGSTAPPTRQGLGTAPAIIHFRVYVHRYLPSQGGKAVVPYTLQLPLTSGPGNVISKLRPNWNTKPLIADVFRETVATRWSVCFLPQAFFPDQGVPVKIILIIRAMTSRSGRIYGSNPIQ